VTELNLYGGMAMEHEKHPFGKYLSRVRDMSNMSLEELSYMTKIPIEQIKVWEAGTEVPEYGPLLDLIDALQLGIYEANSLLKIAGYEPLTSEANLFVNQAIPIFTPNRVIMNEHSYDRTIIDRLSKNMIQINDAGRLEEQLKALRSELLEQMKRSDISGTVSQELRKLVAAVMQAQVTAQRLKADVILPAAEDMQVRLISAHSFERLEEYRSEESKWFSVAGIFGGSTLGIFVNAVTGGVLNEQSWIFVVVSLALTILTGATAYNYQRRAERLKLRIERKSSISKQETQYASSLEEEFKEV
jgi:hypothetical protein